MVEKCRFDKKERRKFFDEKYVSNKPKYFIAGAQLWSAPFYMIFLSLRFLRSCQGKKDISFTFLRFREFLSTQRRPRLNHTLINDHYFIVHLKQSFDAIFNKMFNWRSVMFSHLFFYYLVILDVNWTNTSDDEDIKETKKKEHSIFHC